MKKSVLANILLIASAFTLLSGCKKSEPVPVIVDTCTICNESKQHIVDHTIAENEFDDVVYTVQFAMEKHEQNLTDTNVVLERTKKALHPSDCWVRLREDTILKEVIVVFDSAVCLDDQKARIGNIRILYSDFYRNPGATFNVSFENYYVDGIGVSGTIFIENNGYRADSSLLYNVTINNGAIKLPSNKVIDWSGTRKWLWKEGAATVVDYFDDIFEVYGEIDAKDRTGTNFKVMVTKSEALIFDKESICPFLFTSRVPVSGVAEITKEDITQTIDYGNSTCDRTINIEQNNESETFLIPL